VLVQIPLLVHYLFVAVAAMVLEVLLVLALVTVLLEQTQEVVVITAQALAIHLVLVDKV
jgi:hypothetical protein